MISLGRILLVIGLVVLLIAAAIIQAAIEEVYLRRRCESLEAALDALNEARGREQ